MGPRVRNSNRDATGRILGRRFSSGIGTVVYCHTLFCYTWRENVSQNQGGKTRVPVVKTSSKGQIVIPKELREKLGIGAGRKLLLRLVGNHMEIVPLPDEPVKALRGILKAETSLAAELLEERRRDDAIDEKRHV
ncbi:transcriptional regulator, AbrB family [Syntrophobacter fumaroxidans MPOB]|uniref:Transcriptional regulator, AbrB family n=1 Tax=Syntrophobacter fumaroxidans (strain DSM 10017 / MPOB) TaxID=335543 RepID=A0LLF2_SYNFM|nr:transcriptional regulator, AbrB family [Syntrophobacter fumaroxidans MPOB]